MTVALALQELGPAEIVDASIAYHLAAGVGLVLVPEAGSDATVMIGRDVARDGVRSLPAGEAPERVAAAHGAEWLIRGRVGDVWWPRGAPLDRLLAAVPVEVGAVPALERRFVPVVGEAPYFERTILRRVPPAPALDPSSPNRPQPRLIRRLGGVPGQQGPLRGWFPVEVLSFPVGGEVLEATTGATLVGDVRVRDALRKVAAGVPLSFPRPNVADDPYFAIEVAGLVEAEVVAAGRRIDELERRLDGLEGARLGRRLRGGLRRAARRADEDGRR